MQVDHFQLNENAKPLLNERHFAAGKDSRIKNIETGAYDGTKGVFVTHTTRGRFFVPMTSVSWLSVPESILPAKKPRGRPKGVKKIIPETVSMA